jgi:hypothetical protein
MADMMVPKILMKRSLLTIRQTYACIRTEC